MSVNLISLWWWSQLQEKKNYRRPIWHGFLILNDPEPAIISIKMLSWYKISFKFSTIIISILGKPKKSGMLSDLPSFEMYKIEDGLSSTQRLWIIRIRKMRMKKSQNFKASPSSK